MIQVFFGYSLIVGAPSSRSFFLDLVANIIHIHCSIATLIMSFLHNMNTNTLFEEQQFNEVVGIFRNMPYKFAEHFYFYPEGYVVCGWLIAISGALSILSYISRSYKKE